MKQLPYYQKNIIVLGICIFLCAVSYQIIMPFFPRLLADLGVEEQNISYWTGLIFSCQSAAFMIAAPLWGKVGDTYGRKKMILRAGTVISISYFAMFFCRDPYQLLVVRIVNGFFTGFIPASITLVSTNTPEDRVLPYVAAMQTVSASGTIAGPAVGGFLGALWGFQSSVLVGASAVFVSTIMVLAFVKEINMPRPDPGHRTTLWQDIAISFRNPVIKNLVVMNFFQGICVQGVMPFIIIHMDGQVSDFVSGILYSLPAVAMIFTAQRWSRLGKTMSQYLMIIIGFIGSGAAIVLLANVRSLVLFGIFMFLFGLMNSGITTNLTAKTVSSIEEDFRGRALSIQSTFQTLGAVTTPVTAGIIIQARGTAFSFSAVGILTLVVGILFWVVLKNDLANSPAK
ncbi:MAG: MFS transporter [Abditibacteriota bacterium]|nr:MFS transporter [Abditibacteriota bacterium]